MQQSKFMFLIHIYLKAISHIVCYWENRTPFVSLKIQCIFHVNVSIKTIDKNSNKEFVKHNLVYPSMFIVM